MGNYGPKQEKQIRNAYASLENEVIPDSASQKKSNLKI